MDVPLGELATAARAWDEQHLDVESAAHQILDAPTDGFTAAIAGSAERFTTTWGRHTTDLAQTADALTPFLEGAPLFLAPRGESWDAVALADHLLASLGAL